MPIHRKLRRDICPKKNPKGFLHPIKVHQPIGAVTKRPSLRMVKGKKDHEALEEWFLHIFCNIWHAQLPAQTWVCSLSAPAAQLMLAAGHSPSLLSAAGQESLCPLDKLHFCGSSAGISHHHVGIQEESFTLVTLKQQKITLKTSKQTHPQKNPRDREEGQRDFYKE